MIPNDNWRDTPVKAKLRPPDAPAMQATVVFTIARGFQ